MSLVRNIWTDLVEKKLWPVALLLIGALIAIVVLLGSTPAEPGATAALGATGATSALGAAGQVSLDQADLERTERPGVLRNPFKPRAKPVATGGGDAQTAGPGAGAGLTASVGGTSPSSGGTSPLTAVTDALQASAGGSGDTPLTAPADAAPSSPPNSSGSPSPKPTVPTPGSSSSRPSTPTPPPQSSSEPSFYRVKLNFAAVGAARKSRPVDRTLRALASLPSTVDPSLVYLGVLPNQGRAVFLVSPFATVSGDGVCKPSPEDCGFVELQPRKTARVAVTDKVGRVSEFDLKVEAILDTPGAGPRLSPGEAAKLLEQAGIDRYTLNPNTGALQRTAASERVPAAPRAATDTRSFEGEDGFGSEVKQMLTSPGFGVTGG